VKADARTDLSSAARANEKIQSLRRVLIDDCSISLRMTAERLNIGKDTVRTRVEQNLGKRKVCHSLDGAETATDCVVSGLSFYGTGLNLKTRYR
jgi:hypothetical protein